MNFEQVKTKAEQGEAEAQFLLGQYFEFGTQVLQSHTKAAYWYGRAAEQGFAQAHTDEKTETLLVGVSNPFGLEGIDAIRHLFDSDLEPVIVPPQELLDLTNKIFDRRAAAAQVIDEIDETQVVNPDAGIDDIDIDIIDS